MRIVVAEADGQVVCGAVGEVTALIPGPNTVNGSVGLISNVATRHAWRGRGLAAACTDDLLRWFEHDTDVTRVDLFATQGRRADLHGPGVHGARVPGDVPAGPPLTAHHRRSRVENTPPPASRERRVLYCRRSATSRCRSRRSSRIVAVCCTWVRNS